MPGAGVKMATFAWGFALATVIWIGAGAWLLKRADDQPIMFAQKHYYEFEPWVTFQGSIVGDGKDAPVNNFVRGQCDRTKMSCQFLQMNDLGGKQVGQITEDNLAVRSWTDSEIVADTKGTNALQCNYFEIRIYRKTKEIAYTRVPQPQAADERCKEFFGNRIMRWKIDNGPAWFSNADGSPRER